MSTAVTTTPAAEPLPLAKPTRARFGVLGFACSLSFITYLDRICIMQAKGSIQDDLGLTNVEMGFVFSAFTVGYTLFEVPGGLMGDLWGSRRVITRIVLCWSLFTALTGCVWRFTLDSGRHLSLGSYTVHLALNSLALMLLVRFLFGLGEAGAYPNLTRVVRSWFPFQERAQAQGAIWMSARFGGFLAPILVGWLSAALGWRQAFWILGLVGVSWCLLFYSRFRDSPEEKPGCNRAERDLIGAGTAPADAGHARPPLAGLVSSVTVFALCSASFFVCFGWYFFPTWQPDYLKNVFGISYSDSKFLTGLPFFCGGLGCLAGGGLSDYLVRRTGSRRWGRSLIGALSFAGAGLCMLAAGFAARPWQAVVLLSAAFLINDLAIPLIWTACADVGGRFAGTVSAVMNLAGGLGAILSPILIPQVRERLRPSLSEALTWRVILAGLAVSWFLGAVAWLFIDASKPLFDRPEAD